MEILKNSTLSDKIYEKRKQAALDIEKHVRELVVQNQSQKIHALIRALGSEYCHNGSANFRNGGLIGLAAIAIGLSSDNISVYLNEICPPVIQCLSDLDARVRYYACESMYNICKVAKSESLLFFNELFDACSRLSADTELSVKNGAELLDRLLKDIVTLTPSSANDSAPVSPVSAGKQKLEDDHPLSASSTGINYSKIVERFVPLLSERIYTVNPFTRAFLISWLSVLDSVPELNLLKYLPNFLDGLFGFLDDENNVSVGNLLSQFLNEITNETQPIDVDYAKIITILIPHTRESAADQPKLIALTWLSHLIPRSPSIHELIPSILTSVLPSISHNAPAIKRQAKLCNSQVQTIAMESSMDYGQTINSLRLLFLDKHENTRVSAIEWLIVIHSKSSSSIIGSSDILNVLLNTLTDESDQVVTKDLELLSLMAKEANDEEFTNIFSNLLKFFSRDLNMVESRGALILRSLCYHLDSQRVFLKLAEILGSNMELGFTDLMVQNLGLLLVTAEETGVLRKKLRDEKGGELFQGLYRCWAHNPVSLLSLCLLSQQYEHGYSLIHELYFIYRTMNCSYLVIFSADEVSLHTLVQLDKLVQLLESPVFTYLRLQLLDSQKHAYLIKLLYGILMLLPQSSAFATLRNRLNTISQTILNNLSEKTPSATDLSTYQDVRKRFRNAKDVQTRTDSAMGTSVGVDTVSLDSKVPLKPKRKGFLQQLGKNISSSS